MTVSLYRAAALNDSYQMNDPGVGFPSMEPARFGNVGAGNTLTASSQVT